MCHCSVFGCLFARCWMEQHVAVTQWEFFALASHYGVVRFKSASLWTNTTQLRANKLLRSSFSWNSEIVHKLMPESWWLHLLVIRLTSSPAGLRWHKRLSPPKVFLMDWWSLMAAGQSHQGRTQHPSVDIFSRLKPLLRRLRGGRHGPLSNWWLHLGGISKDHFPRSRWWCWILKHS